MANIGNVSTVATWSAIIVMIIEILLKHFGITISHETIVMFATGLATFIIAIWSSRNPNTFEFLGNGTPAEDAVGDDDEM